ncbi:MAG TPA: DUF4230 domain-containing protein [Flavisolibacter sp.]|nr:DUF4230 domain-containing protein [Flavisolibacter sp.]
MRRIFVASFLFGLAACTPAPVQAAGSNIGLLLVAALLLGALVMFLVGRLYRKASVPVIRESSHTVVESMRRVFKVVFSEGQFNELYTFEETKKLLGFLPTTRKALVIIQAKVLVGYDVSKCVWEANEETRTVKLLTFPEPEILSIEPNYKYYNFDESIFNLMGGEDLNRIQTNGKKQVELAALNSHLPQIAADQMRLMLAEVVHGKQWRVEGLDKIKVAIPATSKAN